jgi:outer membrane protein
LKKGIAIRLAFWTPLALLAATTAASADTLAQALAKAYLGNPTLLAEQANLRAVDESLPQAYAQRRPTITGQASYGIQPQSTNIRSNGQSSGSSSGQSGSGGLSQTNKQSHYSTLYPYSVGINLTQPLWTGGRADAAIAQANYQIKSERATLLNQEETVLLDAATAYFDVYNNQAVLDLAINNVRVLTQALDEANARFQAGLATQTDVSQAEARLQSGFADQRQAEANLINSRAVYRNVVGNWPGTLRPEPPAANLPADANETVGRAIVANPQVLGAQASQEAAAAGVEVADAQLMPSIALTGLILQANNQKFQHDWATQGQILINLTVPVYQAGAEYSKIRQAKETLGQSGNLVDSAIRLTSQNATQAWQNLQAARSRLVSFEAAVKANNIAYTGLVEENRVGTRTTFDVLQGQQDLFGSEVDLVNAQHDEAVASYQIMAVVGELTAEDLGLRVKLYNPQVHYDAVKDKWIGTTPPPETK